jgi:YVTN family beta-propeller protein
MTGSLEKKILVLIITASLLFITTGSVLAYSNLNEKSDNIFYKFDVNNGNDGNSPWGVPLKDLPVYKVYHLPAKEGYMSYENQYDFIDDSSSGYIQPDPTNGNGYYINTLSPDNVHWKWDGNNSKIGKKKLLLIPGSTDHVSFNKKTGKKLLPSGKGAKLRIYSPYTRKTVIAVVGDNGPGPWTGRQFGTSNKVFKALGLPDSTKDGKYSKENPNPGHGSKKSDPAKYPVIKYADDPYWVEVSWADQNLPAGPLDEDNADVMLVLDRSGSMEGSAISSAKKAADFFIDYMKNEDKAGVVSYSTDARYDYHLSTLTSDIKNSIKQKINSISAGGSTAIGSGLRYSLNDLLSYSGPNNRAILLLSDGNQNSGETPSSVIPDIKDNKIKVYTVGLGTAVDQNLLSNIASQTGGKYYSSPTDSQLIDIYNDIAGNVLGLDTILEKNINMNVNDVASIPVKIDSSVTEATFSINYAGSNVDLILSKPDGSMINPSNAATDPDVKYVADSNYKFYRVSVPAVGKWTMKLKATEMPVGGEEVSAVVHSSSTFSMSTSTDKRQYNQGDKVKIIANFSETVIKISKADVKANITLPDSSTKHLVLYDDGKHGDGKANNGIYANYFSNTLLKGNYSVDVVSTGSLHDGSQFSRIGDTSFEIKAVQPAVAYITNDDGTVSVINAASDSVTTTVPVGNDPFGVSVTKDGKKVYVADQKADDVYAIDTTTNRVTATIPIGKSPYGVAVTPDGKKVYVANEADNTVSVINTENNKIKTIPVGKKPFGVAINPTGTKAYVTNSGSSTLYIIDTAKNIVTDTINGLNYPGGITINSAGTKAYVTSGSTDIVYIINTATNNIKAKISVGDNPHGVAVSPDGTKLYVANYGDSTVSVIDTTTNKVKTTVKVGSNPYGIAVTPDGKKVYVANRNSNSVSIINTDTNKVKTTVKVGNHPKAFGQFIGTVS